MNDPQPHGSTRVAIALLVLAWVSFNFPILGGRVPFPVDIALARPPNSLYRSAPPPANPLESDAYDLYYPWRLYLGDRLREGDIPLWDPHRLAGTPFAANPQMAVWYPPNWLFAALPFLAAWTVIAVLSNLGTLLLAFWFFRVLDLHRYAAAAGAIVFAYCGFLLAWAVHPTFLASAMWLPLALGGIEKALRGRPRVGIPLVGIGLALSVLGGQTQVSIYVWLAVGLWGAVAVVAQFLQARRKRSRDAFRELGNGTLVAVTAFVLGAALSSLQLLASLELSERIVRGPEPYDELVSAAPKPRQMATLFIPDRFGNPIDGNHGNDLNYTETAKYVGVAALLLALVGICRRRDRIMVSLALLGVFGILVAFGTPLYRILYGVVPGLSQTRTIGRAVFLFDFALAGLTALGVDTLVGGRRRPKGPVIVSAGVVLAGIVLAAALPWHDLPAGYLVPRVVVAVAIVLAASALALLMDRRPAGAAVLAVPLVGVLALDLWLFGFRYHPFQRPADLAPPIPEVEYLRSLQALRPRIARLTGRVLPLNAALTYDLYDVHGNDTFILARTVELLSVAQDQVAPATKTNQVIPFSAEVFETPVIDLIGVERMVAPLGSISSRAAFANRFAVLDQPGAFPPAFLTTCWETVPPTGALEPIRTKTVQHLASTAIVEVGSASEKALGASGECQLGGPVAVDRYEPERVELTASPTERSVLVLTDAWYPGWEAEVDGREVPVLRVDHAFRGVALSPGRHRIELAYRPGWFPLGLAVTLAAALGVTAYAVGMDRWRRKRTSPKNG